MSVNIYICKYIFYTHTYTYTVFFPRSLFPEEQSWIIALSHLALCQHWWWGSRPHHPSQEEFSSFKQQELACWLGWGLVRVGRVWGFPGRETGSSWGPKGALCGFRCVGEVMWVQMEGQVDDGLGCAECQGLRERGTRPEARPCGDHSYLRRPISRDLSRASGVPRETMKHLGPSFLTRLPGVLLSAPIKQTQSTWTPHSSKSESHEVASRPKGPARYFIHLYNFIHVFFPLKQLSRNPPSSYSYPDWPSKFLEINQLDRKSVV